MGLVRNALLWGSRNRWLERQFRRRRFATKAVSRFMPGEDVASALRESGELAKHGIATVLTQLGENVTAPSDADAVVAHYRDVMDRIAAAGLASYLSVKPTQLGLDLDAERTADHLIGLAEGAAGHGQSFAIDMEGSDYVDPTLALYRRARAQTANVALCLQAYLHRTPADLEALLEEGAWIRLVKGAYREPARVALPRKADVDAAYFRLALRLIEHAAAAGTPPPAIATHDTALLGRLARETQARGLPADAYEVQMLYGIRRQEQRRLAAAGTPVRVLISYGEAWFPWYMRRLAERPANLAFVAKSMFWA